MIGKTVISLPSKEKLGIIIRETDKLFILDSGKKPRKDAKNIKWKILQTTTQQTVKQPQNLQKPKQSYQNKYTKIDFSNQQQNQQSYSQTFTTKKQAIDSAKRHFESWKQQALSYGQENETFQAQVYQINALHQRKKIFSIDPYGQSFH